MASGVREEVARLRKVLRVALGAALAAGQVALPFACGDEAAPTSSGAGSAGGQGSGTSTSASGGGSGGAMNLDAGPDTAPDARDKCAPEVFIPDGAQDCEKFVHLPCGLPPDAAIYANCYLNVGDCTSVCAGPAFNCMVTGDACIDDGGTVIRDHEGGLDLECAVCLSGDGSVGRLPAGLRYRARCADRARDADHARCADHPRGAARARGPSLGGLLARAAELEGASVYAFRALRAELAYHGAPASLRNAAARAEADESRHARSVARLARRFGGAPRRARVAPVAPRSLEAVALENAIEGCARETFGALLATFQAARATDPEARRVFRAIAAEETRHAALASAVDQWASRRLSPSARRRVQAARRKAVADIGRGAAGAELSLAARALIGWPSQVEQRELAAALRAALA